MSFPRELYLKEAQTQNRSPEFIAATLAYADHLTAGGLPVIFSTKHLAIALEIPFQEFKDLIRFREYCYKFYAISKRRGGVRQISAPFSNLKPIQKWINQEILAHVPISEQAMGFRTGKSIRQNADPHTSKKFILNMDLLKFFDTITEYRVYQIFAGIGYAPNLALDLARLTTVPLPEAYYDTFSDKEQELFQNYFDKEWGVLPQGAPTSPALSNMAAISLDSRLAALADASGCAFTRYADDITISSDTYEALPKLNELAAIIREEGFLVNWKKAKIFKRGQRQLVTGLTVTSGLHVPKNYRKDVARHIHFCLKYGPEAHLKRIGKSDKKFYKDWLEGRILYINAISPAIGRSLLADFNAIKWPF